MDESKGLSVTQSRCMDDTKWASDVIKGNPPEIRKRLAMPQSGKDF